jgi:hypothetical protein
VSVRHRMINCRISGVSSPGPLELSPCQTSHR